MVEWSNPAPTDAHAPLARTYRAGADRCGVCDHGNVSGIDPTADKISVDSVQDLATRWLSLRSARLAMDAAYELRRRDANYALATMCVGVGQGVALALGRM